MDERELEEAMRHFHLGEADLLLCTAIVGAGLDLPRANTILVERADTFGLADLFALTVRPTPHARSRRDRLKEYRLRMAAKAWPAIWPGVQVVAS